jgi:hypothetical protein
LPAFPERLAAGFVTPARLVLVALVAAFLADFLVAVFLVVLAIDFLVAVFLVTAFAAFFRVFLDAAFFEAAFLVGPAFLALDRTLPTTKREPIDGMIVDSSPPDHVTRSNPPLTPVTTPSRGGWPTRFEGT